MAIYLPDKCLRGLVNQCEPWAQIESDDGVSSFVCCGHLNEEHRALSQDEFRVCWKNDVVDEIGDYDRRDLIDTASVIMQALSVDANIKG